MKTHVLIVLWHSLVLAANAAVPSGYYSTIDGKQAVALKSALSGLIQNKLVLEYDSLWALFTVTDTRSDGTVWDMYSNRRQTGFSGMNREHAFPKSWWGGSRNAAYSDLHHLFPADEAANLAKSNHPLGNVGIPVFDNGVSKVGYDSFQGNSTECLVFEPADTYKGDFARAYFYVATCYQDLTWKHTFMVETNSYPTFRPEAVRLLMDWHRKDPVSTKERTRNEAVYTFQHNRNPFIDYPELASYLWGDSTAYAFSLTGREGSFSRNEVLQLYANLGSIYIQTSLKDRQVIVFNPLGIRLSSVSTTGTIQFIANVSPGIYLVTCSGYTWKVVVK